VAPGKQLSEHRAWERHHQGSTPSGFQAKQTTAAGRRDQFDLLGRATVRTLDQAKLSEWGRGFFSPPLLDQAKLSL
jgi:hypothetical protein